MTALEQLNIIRKGLKAKARSLCRKIPRMNLQNLRDNEESYKELECNVQEFHHHLNVWDDHLPLDEEGEPIYPEDEFGGGFRPEKVKPILDNFQAELYQVRLEICKIQEGSKA